MTQNARFFGGTTVGQATDAPYSSEKFADVMGWITTYDRTIQGVLPTNQPNYVGDLEVTTPGGAVVRVAPGVGVVDGVFYFNDANVDNNVAAASVWYVVGLRKTYAAQTVLIFIRGTYASRALALASLVQTDSVTWEIPLATVLTTAGSIVSSITDERRFVYRPETKRVLLTPTVVWNDTDVVAIEPSVMSSYLFPNSKLCTMYALWRVPEDFHSALVITPLGFSSAFVGAGDVYARTYIEYNQIGEIFASSTEDTGYAEIAVVSPGDGVLQTLNPLSVTSAEVGDYIGIRASRDATNPADDYEGGFYAQAILVEYTPIY